MLGKITAIHPDDAFYKNVHRLVGKHIKVDSLNFDDWTEVAHGWWYGRSEWVSPEPDIDGGTPETFFFGIKWEEVPPTEEETESTEELENV